METPRLTTRSAAAIVVLAATGLIASCDGSTSPPAFPDLAITTTALPAATAGESYQATVHAQGGDDAYQWTVSAGALPPGLALTTGPDGEAVLSGEPTTPGEFGFTLRVQSGDGQSETRAFTLSVGFTTLAIVTAAIPSADQRQEYHATVHAEGGDGDYQWAITSGALPPGVELTVGDDGEAVLSGSPDAAGDFAFSLRVTSGDGQTTSRTFTLVVAAGLPELVIETGTLPPAAQGHAYQATVTATGGDGSYEWTITSGSLPPGLTLAVGSEGQAVIEGQPTQPGEFEFTLQVQSGDGQTAARTYAIVVGEDFPELVIVTESLPSGELGETYSEGVHAAGGDGAYDWDITAGALPPGLALTVDDLGEGDQAILSGVPEEAGTFTFTLTVVSGDGQSASREFSITVESAPPVVVETPAVPPALANASYDVGLRASGGDGQTFQWTVVAGTLPPGLNLTTGGRIQGTPTGQDTATFTVEVASAGQTSHRSFDLAVVPHRTDEYNITIFPVTPIPDGVLPHVREAVAEWEAAVTENLGGVIIPTDFFGSENCAGFGALMNGASIDDIMIAVSIEPIDGPGGVLGRAGPCATRSANGLPVVGMLILDSDDLDPLIGNETLTYIISHEIAHVLGFGTIWSQKELIQGAGGDDPRFLGTRAVQEYQALGGSGTVPVENQGGAGTRDGHWRQTDFGNERMTGFSAAPGVFQPLSRVSIGSFIDKGYAMDMGAADSFSLGAALQTTGEGAHEWHGFGHDEILRMPIKVLYPDGSSRTIYPD